MENRDFYKTGKISDYLYMKEKGKERHFYGRTDKGKRSCDKTGELR